MQGLLNILANTPGISLEVYHKNGDGYRFVFNNILTYLEQRNKKLTTTIINWVYDEYLIYNSNREEIITLRTNKINFLTDIISFGKLIFQKLNYEINQYVVSMKKTKRKLSNFEMMKILYTNDNDIITLNRISPDEITSSLIFRRHHLD